MVLGEIKEGSAIELDGQPYFVVSAIHSKIARGGALVKAKLKNVRDGSVVSRTLKPSDNFDELDLDRAKASFLYSDRDLSTFMNKDDFEQFTIANDVLGKQKEYLKEGLEVDILQIDSEAVGIQLPIKVDYKVTEAPPNVKGNSVSSANKQVTIETGLVVSAPLFINEGDIIKINTTNSKYIERVSKT